MAYKGQRVTLGGQVANYFRGESGVVLDTFKELREHGLMGYTNSYDYLAKVRLDSGSVVTVHTSDLK